MNKDLCCFYIMQFAERYLYLQMLTIATTLILIAKWNNETSVGNEIINMILFVRFIPL